MNTIFKFLQDCQTFYLATVEGGQPRVRPLGAVCIYDDKLYICTNNKKPMSKQMKANPKVEISATASDRRWLRLTAEAVADDSLDSRKAMLEAIPALSQMYKADDGLFEVFYLKNATGIICSFQAENETHTF